MRFSFEPTRAQLKVFSAVCSNLVVVWLIAMVGTRDIFILIFDITFAILSWYLAVKAEEALENYDRSD